LYADNGAPFANAWLARTCAVLGIRLVHSKPYSPQGRGKQPRPPPGRRRRRLRSMRKLSPGQQPGQSQPAHRSTAQGCRRPGSPTRKRRRLSTTGPATAHETTPAPQARACSGLTCRGDGRSMTTSAQVTTA
jgi:hypothetical protein